jgi:hypothetical protein
MTNQPVVEWNEAPQVIEPGDPLPDATFIKPPADAVYRPAGTVARVAAALVGLSVVLHAIDALVSLYGISLVSNLATTTEDDLVAYDQNAALVAMVLLVTYIAAAIAMIAWLRRLVTNVLALGGGPPAVGPTGAVLWWFVPFANLFKPYQAVADSWRRLATSTGGSSTGTLVAWWLLFLAGNILGNVYAQLPLPETVEAFNGREMVNIASDVATILAGVLLIRIMLEVERRSVARSRAVAARVAEDERVAAEAAATSASMASWTLGQGAGAETSGAPLAEAPVALEAPPAAEPAAVAEPAAAPAVEPATAPAVEPADTPESR